MKRKRFSCILLTLTMLVSLLTTFTPVASASETVSYIERSWDGSRVVSVTKTVDATVVQSTSSNLKWSGGWYVVKDDVTISGFIDVNHNVGLILCDGATLTVNNSINVTSKITNNKIDKLSIYGQSAGTGTLKVVAPLTVTNAAIGGNIKPTYESDNEYGYDFGVLDVHGGNVNAKSISNISGVAAIGGGAGGNGGTINIYSGNVNAESYGNGSGIGGGFMGDGGTVNIYGGNVNAISRAAGAGIGAGAGGNGGTVNIYGGNVTAASQGSGAGIGGGAIQDNAFGGDGGTVTICGGNIHATSSSGGEAIGRGVNGKNPAILKNGKGEVSVLHTITLDGASDGESITAIEGVDYNLDGMKILDTNKVYVYLPADDNPVSVTAGGKRYELICSKETNYYTSHNYIDGECSQCHVCTHPNWKNDICTDCGVVKYIECSWDGNKVVKTTKETPVVPKAITSSKYLYEGWYVVKGDFDITQRTNVVGTVNLILLDGADLFAIDGIGVPDGNTLNIYTQSSGDGSITCPKSQYSYVAGLGGGVSNEKSGNITIHGGNINVNGSWGAAAIGGAFDDGGNTTIYGGTITAKGGAKSTGIGGGLDGSGGNISIYGGNIIAEGSDGASAIGGTHCSESGNIIIAGGNIKATPGIDFQIAIGGEDGEKATDGKGNPVTLHILTFNGVSNKTPLTALDGVSYSLNDVKTMDTNKLYAYLPSETDVNSVTIGEQIYLCNLDNNFNQNHNIINGVCTRCGDSCSHIYENGKCTICGDECNHIYYRNVIMEPDCFATGLVEYDCGFCDYVFYQQLPSLKHEYTYTLVNNDSQHLGVCALCGHRKQESHSYTDSCRCFCGYISQKSPVHTYESVVTPPTCTEGGYTTYTCTLCEKVTVDDKTDSLGHSGGEMTCTERAICDICGEHYGEEPEGHGWAADDDTCLTPVLCPDCEEVITPARDDHEWDEYNMCVHCATGRPFVFTFMDGDKVIHKADVRANEYYYFDVLEDKDGLTFLGWDSDGDGGADYAGLDMSSAIAVGGDMTFRAVYGDIYFVRYFRIGLDSGEYELSGINPVPENADPLSLDYDYAYWYKPLGWATEPYGEKVYDYGEKIEIPHSMNLYTVARPFEATVDLGAEDAVWNDRDGNPITVIRGTITDSNIYLYDFPVRYGYRFMGFVSDEYEYTYFEEHWETGEKFLCVYLNDDSAITAVWEECREHNYINGKCEHCLMTSNTTFAITQYNAAAKTVSVVSPDAGTYTIIFSDYEGKKLENVEFASITFTEETKGTTLTASVTNDFNLGKGDKIMLWSDVTDFVPKCAAYIVN